VFARRSKETGQAKGKTGGGGGSKRVESREEIGYPRYCGSPSCQAFSVNQKEVFRENNQWDETSHREESEEKTEFFTGTSCATSGRDESQVGRQKSGR